VSVVKNCGIACGSFFWCPAQSFIMFDFCCTHADGCCGWCAVDVGMPCDAVPDNAACLEWNPAPTNELVVVNAASTVTLKCKARGRTTPAVTWFKNGLPFLSRPFEAVSKYNNNNYYYNYNNTRNK
jgi:hypothetical protein